METLVQDLRHVLRTARKSPGLFAIAALTLALGVGANVAILAVVRAVVLRPLPFPDPDRIIRVYDDLPGAGAANVGMSVPELGDLQRAGLFDGISAVVNASTALSGADRVERIELLGTSPNYFDLLGVKAALGRTYSQAEWRPGFLEGVVISDALWRRQFGGDPKVIGRRIRVDEDPYTIVGVMGPGFRHPGATLAGDVDIWAATGFSGDPFPAPPKRALRLLPGALARLKPHLTLAQAQQRLDLLALHLQHEYPGDYPARLRWSFRVEGAQAALTGDVRPMLLFLLGAVALVLVIVCVNIASLLIARASARSKEFAIRQALGGTRARLIQQAVTESLLLSLVGGVAACVVLWVLRERLFALLPADIPRISEVSVEWSLVVAGLALSLATGLACGVGSALFASATDPARALREGGRSGGAHSVRHLRARSMLVTVEIAMSAMLLVAAGLLVRSFVGVLTADPGVRADGVVVGQVWVPVPNHPDSNRYRTPTQQAALARELLDRVGRLPGVEQGAVASSDEIPLLGAERNPDTFILPDESAPQTADHAALFGAVSAHYFDALGTTVTEGRPFSDHDDLAAPKAAIVNEAFAHRFLPNGRAVGTRLRDARGVEFRIVGVVRDVRSGGLDRSPQPQVYTSILQQPTIALAVFLRTHSGVAAAKAAVAKVIADVDPELPVFGVRALSEIRSASVARRRFTLILVCAFAATALLLAALGIYGVMAFITAQRTQEFGVRRALGATPNSIMVLAIRPALTFAVVGICVGLATSVLITRLMGALVFGVSPSDPLTFGVVVCVLLGGTLGACIGPARMATHVSPLEALRS